MGWIGVGCCVGCVTGTRMLNVHKRLDELGRSARKWILNETVRGLGMLVGRDIAVNIAGQL